MSVDFAGQKKTTKADKNGIWLLRLDPLEPSAEGRTLLASNAEGDSIAIKDILVGDVWLCAGQSNMRMSLRACLKSKPVADAHKKAGNNFTASLYDSEIGLWMCYRRMLIAIGL